MPGVSMHVRKSRSSLQARLIQHQDFDKTPVRRDEG